MAKKITEKFVEAKILGHLDAKGWNHNVITRELHEHGCDIIVTQTTNLGCRFYIECKGKSYAKSARSVHETIWLFALGQIITRMNVVARHAYKYGLGLPEVSAKKALRRIPWQAARHLCLYIFSVDDSGEVTEFSPKDFRKFQR